MLARSSGSRGRRTRAARCARPCASRARSRVRRGRRSGFARGAVYVAGFGFLAGAAHGAALQCAGSFPVRAVSVRAVCGFRPVSCSVRVPAASGRRCGRVRIRACAFSRSRACSCAAAFARPQPVFLFAGPAFLRAPALFFGPRLFPLALSAWAPLPPPSPFFARRLRRHRLRGCDLRCRCRTRLRPGSGRRVPARVAGFAALPGFAGCAGSPDVPDPPARGFRRTARGAPRGRVLALGRGAAGTGPAPAEPGGRGARHVVGGRAAAAVLARAVGRPG